MDRLSSTLSDVLVSALDPVLEHLASCERRNTLGWNGDFFAGLGVQALTSRTLTGFEGAETKDGNFFAFNDGIDDGFDGSINHLGDVGFGQLGTSCNQVDQISFVHLRKRQEAEMAL